MTDIVGFFYVSVDSDLTSCLFDEFACLLSRPCGNWGRQSMSFDCSVNVCYPRQERVNVSYYKYDLENE